MANDSDSQLSTGGGQSSSSGSSLLSTIGSVVGAISNPIGSIISWLANKDAAKERNKFAIEQWERENAYNHPAAQVSRLKSAGLNPALMYENGASGLVSASSPDIAVPSPANFQGIDPLTVAQIANINADTQKKQSETKQIETLLPFNVQNLQANNEVLAQKVKNMTVEQQKLWSEIAFIDVQKAVTDKQCDEMINLWNSQEFLNNSMRIKNEEECRQLIALYNLRKQGIELSNQEIVSRIGLNISEANRLNKMLSVLDSQISLNYSMSENQRASASTTLFLAPYEAIFKKMSASLQYYQAKNAKSHPSKTFLGMFADDLFGDGYSR